MEINEAKKILDLQACINQLLDDLLVEVENVDVESERASLDHTVRELIADCLCNIILPITSQHPGLDKFGANSLAKNWWENAKARRFRLEAEKYNDN